VSKSSGGSPQASRMTVMHSSWERPADSRTCSNLSHPSSAMGKGRLGRAMGTQSESKLALNHKMGYNMNTTWICTIPSSCPIFTQKLIEIFNFQLSRFSRCVHAHLGFFHADFTFFHGNFFGHDHPNFTKTSVLVHIWTNCFATCLNCCQQQGG
jgi:hypothetical protein